MEKPVYVSSTKHEDLKNVTKSAGMSDGTKTELRLETDQLKGEVFIGQATIVIIIKANHLLYK